MKTIRFFSLSLLVSFLGMPAANAQSYYYDSGSNANTNAQAQVNPLQVVSPQITLATETMSAIVGKPFILDGSKSQDDEVIKTFIWRQVSGPVAISGLSGTSPSVVPQTPGTYVFELSVTDTSGTSSVAQRTTVTVAAQAIFQPNESDLDFITKNAGGSENDDATTSAESIKADDEDNSDESSDIRKDITVTIRKSQVRGWDPKKKEEFLESVKEWAQVKSGQDIENFAAGILLRDDNVQSTSYADTNTEVAYAMPAKFLGLFNASLTARVNVDASGKVKVKYPWFGFLYAKSVSAGAVKGDVEAGLKLLVTSNELQTTAQMFSTISNVMKTKHDTAKNSIGNIR